MNLLMNATPENMLCITDWCLGHLFDTYGNYNGTFYFAGSAVFVSGAICYPLGCINRREKEGTLFVWKNH